MIIDTHTHLYLDDFESPDDAVRRALDAGVGHMIFPNVDLNTYGPMMALHSRFPVETSVAVGLHPTEIKETWKADIDAMHRLLDATPDAVAVGEIGIDLYWDKTFRNEQMDALGIQIQWAIDRQLPVIIHSREGLDEILQVLKTFPCPPTGVMHSFTGDATDIERIRTVAPGMYFGINGIVTFKKSRLPEVLPVIGIDRLLLETDSPYLAPTPYRGRRNESAYIVSTADFVAGILGIDRNQLDHATTDNARRLFNLK